MTQAERIRHLRAATDEALAPTRALRQELFEVGADIEELWERVLSDLGSPAENIWHGFDLDGAHIHVHAPDIPGPTTSRPNWHRAIQGIGQICQQWPGRMPVVFSFTPELRPQVEAGPRVMFLALSALTAWANSLGGWAALTTPRCEWCQPPTPSA